MNSFETVSQIFKNLCSTHGVPEPLTLPSLDTDPCDFTSPQEVRLNVQAAGDIDPDYHAGHVFGHYLCGLHEAADNGETNIEPALCDHAADVVAALLSKEQRLVQAEHLLQVLLNNGMNGLPPDKSNAIYLYFFRQEHPEASPLIDQLEERIPCLG